MNVTPRGCRVMSVALSFRTSDSPLPLRLSRWLHNSRGQRKCYEAALYHLWYGVASAQVGEAPGGTIAGLRWCQIQDQERAPVYQRQVRLPSLEDLVSLTQDIVGEYSGKEKLAGVNSLARVAIRSGPVHCR
jgi:hypothetical protein